MAMIRRADVGHAAREAIVLNLGDVVREGQGVLASARQQAQQILSDAKAERERLVAGGREEGFAAGLAEGTDKGVREGIEQGRQSAEAEWKERLAAVQAAWASALGEFSNEREQLMAAARVDVLRLALSIAERVVRRAIAADPTLLEEQISRVLEMLSRPTRLKIRIHPDDEAACRTALPALMQRYSAAEHVEVVCDASLARGSCVARSAGGEIDASIATMLDRIARGVLPCDVQPTDTRLVSPTLPASTQPGATDAANEAGPQGEAA